MLTPILGPNAMLCGAPNKLMFLYLGLLRWIMFLFGGLIGVKTQSQ